MCPGLEIVGPARHPFSATQRKNKPGRPDDIGVEFSPHQRKIPVETAKPGSAACFARIACSDAGQVLKNPEEIFESDARFRHGGTLQQKRLIESICNSAHRRHDHDGSQHD